MTTYYISYSSSEESSAGIIILLTLLGTEFLGWLNSSLDYYDTLLLYWLRWPSLIDGCFPFRFNFSNSRSKVSISRSALNLFFYSSSIVFSIWKHYSWFNNRSYSNSCISILIDSDSSYWRYKIIYFSLCSFFPESFSI